MIIAVTYGHVNCVVSCWATWVAPDSHVYYGYTLYIYVCMYVHVGIYEI